MVVSIHKPCWEALSGSTLRVIMNCGVEILSNKHAGLKIELPADGRAFIPVF